MDKKIQEAAATFTTALIGLIEAVMGSFKPVLTTKAAVTAEIVEAPKEEKKAAWPKNFSEYRKAWNARNPDDSLVKQVFEHASAVCFKPEKIDMVVMGEPEFEAEACGAENSAAILAQFKNDLGFVGSFGIRGATSDAKSEPKTEAKEETKKLGRPANTAKKAGATAKAGVTAEELKKVCVEVATKASKDVVYAILDKFGGRKVESIDPAKYPDVMAALKGYAETTTAEADTSEGF